MQVTTLTTKAKQVALFALQAIIAKTQQQTSQTALQGIIAPMQLSLQQSSHAQQGLLTIAPTNSLCLTARPARPAPTASPPDYPGPLALATRVFTAAGAPPWPPPTPTSPPSRGTPAWTEPARPPTMCAPSATTASGARPRRCRARRARLGRRPG